ncbi:hypothetical protein, partial [Mycobacterium avium]|uniref:hypothetical protein n=1 Tax=Mycobacterium avium TaxID=1764 RepID=UPI001F3D0E81
QQHGQQEQEEPGMLKARQRHRAQKRQLHVQPQYSSNTDRAHGGGRASNDAQPGCVAFTR